MAVCFRVTQGLLNSFGAQRVMDTPLSESAIVGVAIGMAVYGLRPIAEIQFEGFAYAAMEQLPIMPAGSEIGPAGVITVRSSFGFLMGGIRAPSIIPIATKRISFMYWDSK
jgi:pyruvate dehydrogenase E1 component beta subunit